MKRLFVSALLFLSTSSVPAWAIELVDVATQEHPVIAPGRSISVVIFHESEQIPLATVIGFKRSSTVVYTVEHSTRAAVVVRAFNLGPFWQSGAVIVGFWE